MEEMYCIDCDARFKNQCHCPDKLPTAGNDIWTGFDGHMYVGDKNSPSNAEHSMKCLCYTNPEEWY